MTDEDVAVERCMDIITDAAEKIYARLCDKCKKNKKNGVKRLCIKCKKIYVAAQDEMMEMCWETIEREL